MKKINKVLPFVLTAFIAVGCSGKTELPDVAYLGQIEAVSREEGSGTRAEFESLLNTDGAGTDLIAISTDEVSELVAGSEAAIGYAAYSSTGDFYRVKAISVDGVSPDSESIKDGSYPLCRSYYAAYSGELSDVEADFLSFVLSAGQETVKEFALPVKESQTFLSDKSAGTIKIAGSSSVAPIIAVLAEDYKAYNPNAEIELEVSDSTQGLTAALRGECDIALSSRDLKDYEEELLTKKAIAKDAIAVIVNSDNPVTGLTSSQIKKIYSGEFEAWADLN